MPPGPRRMLTPEIASEIAKSACVTCRAQPPFWMRFCALLNEPQNSCMSPTSVGGGLWKDGNWLATAGFWGPGSASPPGLALIAPCGGLSGLPNEAALAAVATIAAPPAAPSARMSRREKADIGNPSSLTRVETGSYRTTLLHAHSGLGMPA